MSQATRTKTVLERLRAQSPIGWMLRCGLVGMAVLASMGTRLSLEAWVGPGLPTYITFYPTVMVVALLVGFVPGALTTVLVCFMTAYWILSPVGQLFVGSPVDRLGLLFFLCMGLFMSAVAELYRRNRDRAVAYEREMSLKESQEILRRQSELIDPVRAQIIAREMLRVLSESSDIEDIKKPGGSLRNASAVVTWIVYIAGVTAILIGGFHLAAWLGGFAAQWSMTSGQIIMKTNMALCQILAGISLLLLRTRFFAEGCDRQGSLERNTTDAQTSPLQLRNVVGALASLIVLTIGVLTLSEHLFHYDLGIDQLLAREAPGARGTVSPNRIGIPGSLSLTLLGAGLLALALRRRAAVSFLGLAVCVVNLLPAMVFLYGYGLFYNHPMTGIAWPTVLVLSMLGLALVMARRESGLMALLLRDDLGGVLLRRLLPAALLVPFLLGWLIHKGGISGLYDVEINSALFALLMITVLMAMIWWAAHALNRSDTVRCETEARLNNLTEVMNHAHEPLIVREPGGVIHVWNRGAESLFGWPAADALGQSIQILLHTEGPTPEEIDSQLESMGLWEGELIQTTRDGRRVTVESRQTAKHIGNGQLLILESNLDITERKRSEDELRKSREEALVLMQDAVAARQIAEQAEKDLQKANDELEVRVVERTRELAQTLQNLQIETSERIQAVEALREKEHMLIQQSRQAAMGEMIGNIAHQWRQPLNVVALQVQQLLMLHDFGKLTRESLSNIVSSSMEQIRHMSGTIDDFRNYFRPDRERTDFELSGVITNTLSLLEESFRNERIRIDIMTIDEPVITGYRNEFAQALVNILNNARDALIEREINSPTVTITISTEGDRAVVSIADNAGGIPVEIIGKIFDPYFTTKGPQAGTGVGLFMSKSIIEKNMGGRLSVCNTATGAEFRIEI